MDKPPSELLKPSVSPGVYVSGMAILLLFYFSIFALVTLSVLSAVYAEWLWKALH